MAIKKLISLYVVGWENQLQVRIFKLLFSWNHFWNQSRYWLEFNKDINTITSGMGFIIWIRPFVIVKEQVSESSEREWAETDKRASSYSSQSSGNETNWKECPTTKIWNDQSETAKRKLMWRSMGSCCICVIMACVCSQKFHSDPQDCCYSAGTAVETNIWKQNRRKRSSSRKCHFKISQVDINTIYHVALIHWP